MCTVSVILRQSERYPLVVAANRDEYLARPSRSPFLWDRSPRIFAGRDERAGGTWMGVNEHGLFAGLANLHMGRAPDPSLRSRGEVVLAALSARTPEDAREALSEFPPGATNPFLLVCADAEGSAFWTASEPAVGMRELAPGVHTFGNVVPGSGSRKLEEALALVSRAWRERRGEEADDVLRALAPALGTHTGDRGPSESLCVHLGEPERFGTVSSTVLLVGSRRDERRWFHAGGAPCRTPFGDVGDVMASLWR